MEEFKDEIQKIHAPADLVEKTKILMHQENAEYIVSESEENIPRNNLLQRKWAYGLLAAAVLFVILILQKPAETNDINWYTFDTGSDIFAGKYEGPFSSMDINDFQTQSEMDLHIYTEKDGFKDAAYQIDDGSSVVRFLYDFEGNECIVYISEEEPEIDQILKTNTVTTIEGRSLVFFKEKDTPVYNAIWEEEELWFRAVCKNDQEAFISFLKKFLSK